MSLHIGIDAINLRMGGGVTHLSQLLHAADPEKVGVDKISVWACQATADQLPDRPWLIKYTLPWMEYGLPRRLFFQRVEMPRLLRHAGCQLLFSPGGTVVSSSPVPVVTMSQNMLPFEPEEALRFGRFSLMRLKMRMLRFAQSRAFSKADGVIFLTQYAQESITTFLCKSPDNFALIPHGIEPRFLQPPRRQRNLSSCSDEKPFTLLYVSILMPYKQQINVAHAVHCLRKKGVPVQAAFVGASWGGYGKQFHDVLMELDPEGRFLKWEGHVPFGDLHAMYSAADMFVFASSCENLPNILIEAMASGLPIACSNHGPMPEILGSSGLYFDPLDIDSISDAIYCLADDKGLREKLANEAWMQAHQYSWERCANETLEFIASIAPST